VDFALEDARLRLGVVFFAGEMRLRPHPYPDNNFGRRTRRESHRLPMDFAHHEPQFRFDIRAEREECERLFLHQARVLQDRMVRRTRTDRTKHPATPEWEKVYRAEAQERRLRHQARVLSWGKEKRDYYAQSI
jgi:hypothetical protein